MGLIQQFQKAGAQRRKEVAALGREVTAMRADANAFVGHLHRVSADRRKEVATTRADAGAFVGHLHRVSVDRRKEVATMRADAGAFVGHLHRVSAGRRKEVATMRADAGAFVRHLHQVSADRRKEVAALVADADAFVRHLHQVSADRRKEVAAIHVEVWGGAAPHMAPTPAAVAAAAPAGTTLRDVIFAYLAEHPDGARLAQMEHDLGMARIKLAGEMRSLIDEKKVEKRDLLYFAV